jgi:hypothetical protein
MREKCAKRTGVLADPIMLNILDQELLSRALPPEPKKEKDNAYWRAIATEQAHRDKLTAELAAKSPIDYRD